MHTLDKAPPDIQVQAHATYARALMHLKPAQAQGRVRHGPQASGATAARRRPRSPTPTRREGEDSQAHKLGKALDAVGEAMFFAAEEQEEGQGRFHPVPRLQGPGHQGRHQEVHGQDADALGRQEAGRHRGRRQGLPEDHRAPARAAAPLGHRRRVARGHDVGQLRRRLPQGAVPQGLGQEGLRAGHGRHALLERGQGDLPRAPRRGVGAHQEARRRSPRSSAASTTR